MGKPANYEEQKKLVFDYLKGCDKNNLPGFEPFKDAVGKKFTMTESAFFNLRRIFLGLPPYGSKAAKELKSSPAAKEITPPQKRSYTYRKTNTVQIIWQEEAETFLAKTAKEALISIVEILAPRTEIHETTQFTPQGDIKYIELRKIV